jgi:type IV secretory pathway VirJ component
MKISPLFLTALVALLVSCDDSQLKALQRQKMEAEAKANQMQLDLDKAKEEAKAANPEEWKAKVTALEEQLKQAQEAVAAAESAPKAIPEAELEQSWVKEFNKSAFTSLFGGQVPNASTDSIVIPDPEKTYSRKVTLTSGAISIPFVATADATGKWKIPTPEVVAAANTAARPAGAPQGFQPQPNTPPPAGTPGAPPAAPTGTPTAGNTPPSGNRPPPSAIPPPQQPGKGLSGAKLQEF